MVSWLSRYLDEAKEGIAQAERSRPGFFDDKQERLQIKIAQLGAIEKLIGWLHGEDGLTFTEEELGILGEDSVGAYLQDHLMLSKLPHAPREGMAP